MIFSPCVIANKKQKMFGEDNDGQTTEKNKNRDFYGIQ